MRTSIASMQERILDLATNTARVEDFAPTPGHACRGCNFRGVCAHAR
jgi:hypothetical protein